MRRLTNHIIDFFLSFYVPFPGCPDCPDKPAPLQLRAPQKPNRRFPVDIVYTWVDGTDPAHAQKRAQYLPGQQSAHADGVTLARFRDNEELRYSLRSLEAYLPWVRRVFIVTDSQTPRWLDTRCPKVQVVDHTEIIPAEYLPTFNSRVIESHLHRVPGLAEHYISLNDDFFFCSPCTPGDFFTTNGLPYMFIDWRERRMTGYCQKNTPHACSFFNTLDFLDQAGIQTDKTLITAHGPYPQTVSCAEKAFAFYLKRFEGFFPHKFRAMDEISFYAHAAPLWAYPAKLMVPCDAPHYYINTKRRDRRFYYTSMLKQQNTRQLPPFFCLNDAAGKNDHGTAWREDMAEFLERFFPQKSSFEK